MAWFQVIKTTIAFSAKFQVTFQDHFLELTLAWGNASTDFQIS